MFNIATVQPGQRVTVRYASAVTWARTTDNPFVDMDVTRQMVVAFTAAGPDTYHNMADKLDHETSGKPAWHRPEPSLGPCVRVHRTKGTPYLAGINHDTCVAGFFIGGKPVTQSEEAQIRAFLDAPSERERGLDFRVWTVEKLQNAVLE
jgi:hypothetical protein